MAVVTRPVTTMTIILGNRLLDATATVTMTKTTKTKDAKDNTNVTTHQTMETTTRSPRMIEEMTMTKTQHTKE